MQIKIYSVFFLLMFCSCEKTNDPFVVDEKTLSTNSIVGIWMIDEPSVNRIKGELGYVRYRNATDHILRINQDGSCVYTGFALYVSRRLFSIAEQDEVNNMRNYYNNPFPKVINKYYWFEVAKKFPFVIGPYQNNNILTNDNSRVFEKTVWSHWRIWKRQNSISVEDFTQPHYWNYKLELYPTEDEKYDGSSVNMYFARDDQGIYLFIPIVTDDGPILDGIKFRKITN